jgi:hypothetical protein
MNTRTVTRLLAGVSIAALAACKPAAPAANAATAPTATAPAVPAIRTLSAGSRFTMATNVMITSKTAKPGDGFSATVVSDVLDAAGRIAIPAGSTVNGTITNVKPAPNPSNPGQLTLAVNSVTVRGTTYPIEATIDSLATERVGRAINGNDALKVGVGAAAGAIVGQVLEKNTKGTVIGAVVGAAAGTAVAAATKSSDIALPAGTHVLVTLSQGLRVSAR